MSDLIQTRMGDGAMVYMTVDEIRKEAEAGMADAVDRAKVPPLSNEDFEKLMEILCDKRKFVSVERGNELILTYDSQPLKFTRLGLPGAMPQIMQTYERTMMSDTLELAYVHYSAKPVRTIFPEEEATVAETLLQTTPLLLYGVMPNMPQYTKPDGPIDNFSELVPQGKIKEARKAQEDCAEMLERDVYMLGEHMWAAGADGIDLDTTAAGGDAEFYGVLNAVRRLRDDYPDMVIEVGLSGEFILGFHAGLKWGGKKLAGMYPAAQCKIVAEAGGSAVGPVVNTNCQRSLPWNLARSVTMLRQAAIESPIPTYANVGMGVGGVPMQMTPPIDAVSRVSTAMAEIGCMDGL